MGARILPTRRQHELLRYVWLYEAEHGLSPTYAEIAAALGLRSKSNVHRLITGMVSRGLIRTVPKRTRALNVVSRSKLASEVPPSDQTTRIVTLPRDLNEVLVDLAAKVRISPNQIIADALRDYILEPKA